MMLFCSSSMLFFMISWFIVFCLLVWVKGKMSRCGGFVGEGDHVYLEGEISGGRVILGKDQRGAGFCGYGELFPKHYLVQLSVFQWPVDSLKKLQWISKVGKLMDSPFSYQIVKACFFIIYKWKAARNHHLW